jgi:hypothetical protein
MIRRIAIGLLIFCLIITFGLLFFCLIGIPPSDAVFWRIIGVDLVIAISATIIGLLSP